MNRHQTLDDLTIYDQPIPHELASKVNPMKLVYTIFFVLNVILVAFLTVSAFAMFSLLSMIYWIFMVLAMVYSCAYVHYPRSKLARSKVRKFILVVFTVLSIVTFIIVSVAAVTIDFDEIDGWDDDFDDYQFIIVTIVILTYFIPVMHSICIMSIRNIRLKISKEIGHIQQRVQVAYGFNDQNQNIGSHYQPPVPGLNRPANNAASAPNPQNQPSTRPPNSEFHYQNTSESLVRPAQPSQLTRTLTPNAPSLATASHTPRRVELPGPISDHAYLKEATTERKPLLDSFADSRRSSTENPYHPGIN